LPEAQRFFHIKHDFSPLVKLKEEKNGGVIVSWCPLKRGHYCCGNLKEEKAKRKEKTLRNWPDRITLSFSFSFALFIRNLHPYVNTKCAESCRISDADGTHTNSMNIKER
jgi:hypothetical protein